MRKSVLISEVFFGLLLTVVHLAVVSAGTDPPNVLAAKSFTDPTYIQQMPAGWADKPIQHDPELEGVDLAITLDQHLYQALSGEIHEYAKENGLTVHVDEGTCGITAGRLIRKAVDIGGFCCPPGETDRLPGLVFHTYGIMPIALIVNPDNSIDNITLNNARKVFQGEVHSWSELTNSQGQKGPALVIRPVGRLHCKLRAGHWRLLLDNEDLFSYRLQEVGTIPDMISIVGSAPGAIGYEVPMMIERYRNMSKVKILMVNDFAPTKINVISGKYPLYRTFNITTWKKDNLKNPKAEKLVDFLLYQAGSQEGKSGIIPASDLRRAGWKFEGSELVGEPD